MQYYLFIISSASFNLSCTTCGELSLHGSFAFAACAAEFGLQSVSSWHAASTMWSTSLSYFLGGFSKNHHNYEFRYATCVLYWNWTARLNFLLCVQQFQTRIISNVGFSVCWYLSYTYVSNNFWHILLADKTNIKNALLGDKANLGNDVLICRMKWTMYGSTEVVDVTENTRLLESDEEGEFKQSHFEKVLYG